MELGKVLDNQVLFRDIMDCLILAKFNLDFCRDSQIKLNLTDKINQLEKEANLAVKPSPEHLKIQVYYYHLYIIYNIIYNKISAYFSWRISI